MQVIIRGKNNCNKTGTFGSIDYLLHVHVMMQPQGPSSVGGGGGGGGEGGGGGGGGGQYWFLTRPKSNCAWLPQDICKIVETLWMARRHGFEHNFDKTGIMPEQR